MFVYHLRNDDPKAKVAAVVVVAENIDRAVTLANADEKSDSWYPLEARHNFHEGVICSQPKGHGKLPERRQM